MEKHLIRIRKVHRTDPIVWTCFLCHEDEKRRRIVLYLEPLTPEMENTQIASLYHYLKAKAPSMVGEVFHRLSRRATSRFRMSAV